jgi:hypothetical protein
MGRGFDSRHLQEGEPMALSRWFAFFFGWAGVETEPRRALFCVRPCRVRQMTCRPTARFP